MVRRVSCWFASSAFVSTQIDLPRGGITRSGRGLLHQSVIKTVLHKFVFHASRRRHFLHWDPIILGVSRFYQVDKHQLAQCLSKGMPESWVSSWSPSGPSKGYRYSLDPSLSVAVSSSSSGDLMPSFGLRRHHTYMNMHIHIIEMSEFYTTAQHRFLSPFFSLKVDRTPRGAKPPMP